MADQKLVTVFTATTEVEADIIKNALTEEGIQCTVEGALQAGGVGVLGIGVKVQVPANEVTRARAVLEESRRRAAADEDDEEDEEDDE